MLESLKVIAPKVGPGSVNNFSLADAITGRRSRRFGLGMEIPDGPFAFRSKHPPVPLSKSERDFLILYGVGITGWSTGIEHTAAGAADKGCNYPLRMIGRSYASAAGVHSSELIVIDDEGVWLTQFRDLSPASWHGIDNHLVKVQDIRPQLPKTPPHTASHNIWNANTPGSTLFVPLVDLTSLTIELIAIYLGMGLFPLDPATGRPCGDLKRFVDLGLIDPTKPFSLQELEQQALTAGAMEVAQMGQNIMLALQEAGLGGWLFGGLSATSLLGGAKGIPGLKFRFTEDERWFSPNPVGLDGYFEGLCEPYCSDMKAALDQFVALKFGPGGAFDPAQPGPFVDTPRIKSQVERYSPEFLDLMTEVLTYIQSTYGKFPGTIPSVYVRAYIQAHHLDLDFCDHFFGEDSYLENHASHFERWHGTSAGTRAPSLDDLLSVMEKEVADSYANNSRLYRELANTASLEEISRFMHGDAHQPPFYQYLSQWLEKSPLSVKPELEGHIAVEVNEDHSGLFRNMLNHLESLVKTNPNVNEGVLERLNYTFSARCASEQDFGFFLGGFYATEVMSAKRCRQVYEGLKRFNVAEEALRYFRIHFEADEGHGKEVEEQLIRPLLSEHPQLLPSVTAGMRDRLRRSESYIRWYEANVLKLLAERTAHAH